MRYRLPLAMLACVTAWACVCRGSELPEPMPSYSRGHALRGDASLLAVAFSGPRPDGGNTGIACGDRGVILRSVDGGETWSPSESGVDCSLGDVTWIGPRQVVVVGGSYDRVTQISRGVALYSEDGGLSWRRAADEELPRLRSVGVNADQLLIAQCDWSHSLLTRQLESHDGGRNWHAVAPSQHADGSGPYPTSSRQPPVSELRQWASATRARVPIRDACRIEGTGLCAVGDHGVILLSPDGGKTWRAARGEKRRNAILFVASDAASAPWSLMGSESLEHGNRVALLLHDRADSSDRPDALRLELANQVTVMFGGSGADAIATSDAEVAQAARDWIAVNQPAVLVLDPALPALVQDAFFQAATATGVQRVVVYEFDGRSNMALHRDALLAKSGILASDLSADAMHYVAPHRTSAPSITLRYLYDAAPSRRADSLAGGVILDEGQKLALGTFQTSRRQLQIVQARRKQSERIASLIRSSRTSDQLAETLRSTLDQTAKDDQFRLMWSILLETTTTSSPIEFREIVLEELASRFPATSAGRWAQLRLESVRHSIEWQRLRSIVTDSETKIASTTTAERVPVSPFQVPPSGVMQASALSPVVVPKPETQNLSQPIDEQIEVDLTWEYHPLVLIAREAARRRGDDGRLQVASGESANLSRLADATDSPWSGLLRTRGPKVIIARRAGSPPRLDGILDDDCWQSALPSPGRSQRLRVAYDDEYVYVAAQCSSDKLRRDTLLDHSSSNRRDNDLTSVDRVSLLIDTDRDLMTAMELQVSDARRTHDAIDENPQWQPTWYVDTRRTDTQVTVEMAILRRDLVDLPIPVGESWFMAARPLRGKAKPRDTMLPSASDWWHVIFRP